MNKPVAFPDAAVGNKTREVVKNCEWRVRISAWNVSFINFSSPGIKRKHNFLSFRDWTLFQQNYVSEPFLILGLL